LLDDKSSRKILGAAPFHRSRPILHRRAKLRFDLSDAISDRGLTLVKHLLGLLARREIKRWTELTCGYSNRTSIEPLDQLPGDLEAGVIRSV
jgi:hypothetical protein